MPTFVPWEQYGICKWWMLDRCWSGSECRQRHTSEQERRDLWEYHKEKQRREWEEFGIPPPKNPYKHAGTTDPVLVPPGRSDAGSSRPPPGVPARALSSPPAPALGLNPSLGGGSMSAATTAPIVATSLASSRGSQFQLPPRPDMQVSGGTSFLGLSAPSPGAMSPWSRRQALSWEQPGLSRGEDVMADVAGEDVEMVNGEGAPLLPEAQTSTALPTFEYTAASQMHPDDDMGAAKRTSDGIVKPVGPHPSTIRVSAPYLTQAAIEKRLQPPLADGQFQVQERSHAEAREDSMRLQGVTWIDNVRRALSLPIRTYSTACVYYHKFRLVNPGVLSNMEYSNAWADACAASLLMACKNEDTLKKSKDILAAAYNLKASPHDQIGSDDPIFEQQSKAVIGLERMVLEAGGFDFRSKHPHKLFVEIVKTMPEGQDDEQKKVAKVGWTIMTDLYRTFAPLKQTTATMALAALELAAHLVATKTNDNISAIRDELRGYDISKWSTTREQIMETLLDLLDLYTQHTAHTILGTQYSLDDFLRVRLAFNKECNENNLPRYTIATPVDRGLLGSTLQVANGHPTPVSPPQPDSQAPNTATNMPSVPEGGGTLRFMLNPQLAADEKAEVQKYFVEEWEEYEEEIEVPIQEVQNRDRGSRCGSLEGARGERGPMGERERLGQRDRDMDRPRTGGRDGRFGGRFDDRRRFDERRFDDRGRRGR